MKHIAKRGLAMLLALVTVLLVFPVMTSTATATEAEEQTVLENTATVYDKWYVQSGLVMLLSAFGSDNSTYNIANGVWENKAGTDAATIKGGAYDAEKNPYGWKALPAGGIGYTLDKTGLQGKWKGALVLPDNVVNSLGSFTVEYMGTMTGDGTTAAVYTTDVMTEKFGHWGGWRYSGTGGDSIRQQYGPQNINSNYGHQNYTYSNVYYNGYTQSTVPQTTANVIKQDATTESRTLYIDSVQKAQANVPGSGKLATKITTACQSFFLMQNTTCTLYAVRVYNRDLTSAEVAQNHFVDIAAYLGADVSGLSEASEYARTMIFSAAHGWTVTSVTKGDVEGLIERMKDVEKSAYDELYVKDGLTLLATAFDPATSSADIATGKWLNKVGAAGITLQGGVYAEGTNEKGWKQAKGISWTHNVAKLGKSNQNVGLFLDYSVFDKNFTVQLVNAWAGMTDGNGDPYEEIYYSQVYHFVTEEPTGWRTTEMPAEGTNYVTVVEGDVTYYYPAFKDGSNTYYWGTVVQKDANGVDTVTWHKATALNADGSVKSYYGVTTEGWQYGATISDSVAFGNIRNMMWLNHTTLSKRSKGWLDGTERETGSGSDYYANRWYYRSVGYTSQYAMSDGPNNDYFNEDKNILRTYTADDPFVLTLTQEAKETATGVGIYFDNQKFWQADTPTSLVATHIPTLGGMYQVKGIAGEYYAVRVYTKVLSEAEKLQNYFVDVCAYNGLDITGVAELISADPDAAQAMFVAMADFSIRDPRVGAMQAVIDAALEDIVATSAKMNAYDKLYVQSDLVALFTAFDMKDSGLDLAAGTWTDKKSGTVITLVDTSSNTNWEMGANNQGVGYAFRNLKQLDADKYKVGMRLPTEVLTDGNLAIEYTFAITPALTGDGSQDKVHRIDTGMKTKNDKTQRYTDTVYRYTAGGRWGLYNGDTTSNFSFAGLQMCMFQLSDNPEGASMRMRFFYSSKTWEKTGKTLTGASGDKRNFTDNHVFGTDAYNTAVQTMTVNRTVTDRSAEGKHTRVGFTVLLDRVSKQTVNNDVGSDFQRSFYTVADIQNDDLATATAADAFFGFPSTVYAIRIYTDTLTAAEMAQNHAVDLMAYFGLDVRGFAAASAAAKTAVYEAFAAYTFNDADKTGEMQAAIDAAVAGIPVAEGVQVSNDGTALRIWASMDTAENVSRLGMTVVFKKDGVVVSEKSGETNTAFESITSGGKTVTAEELRAELLYAAVVKGIPAGTYTVEVTPYVVMMDKSTVTGETKTMDLTFGG